MKGKEPWKVKVNYAEIKTLPGKNNPGNVFRLKCSVLLIFNSCDHL